MPACGNVYIAVSVLYNKDCNLTAGLEAKLTLAVGARVMLCRNIDTKMALLMVPLVL